MYLIFLQFQLTSTPALLKAKGICISLDYNIIDQLL